MTDASVTPGRLARYVAFWNEREPATALALLRIAIGCVLAYDLIYLACLDLELTIFGDAAEYNMGYTRSLDVQPLVREVFGPGPLAVHVAVYGGIAAAVCFALGLLTRVSGLLVIVTQLQLAALYGEGDRGIDQLLRLATMILVLSQSAATLSLDARLRHGAWARPNVLVPAWPRYLIIAQLVWLYTSAALSKDHSLWSARGDYMSLFYILRYQHFVRWDMTWVPAWVTQVGAFTTFWFEALAGLMVVACSHTRSDPDLLLRSTRGWWAFKRTWIAIGLGLHTTLWILMNIGIFTTGLLAMYACWVNPRLLQRLPATRWWRALRFVPEAASPAGAQPDEPASAPPPAAPQGA
ncbi:MAG: hypothetical protein IPG17_05155 [Sandaracinaceae bacterium]|jgi:hypothetical protein|nr:hypothetical protein [Sandaracinaceae bacterium]MBK6807543.1 hypothetical protein [Sandaracinaceae bacterium]MBK7152352.1 hypothetical protein [Sandaracinaceae bacterium]MBK7774510.1 hypothetical protein [Sandaracinaceae bacterium]MBP7682211.1 hypothetical protein [Deltaproteobacteria bacterium]